jgi:cell division protein FtsN
MKNQRGGTFLGFVLGLMVGLGAALAVAVYVTKVPVPFLDKGTSRPADQDATENKKNKDWDPNAPLYGKNPARPASNAEQVLPTGKANTASDAQAGAHKAELKPAVTADPLGDLAKAKSADKTVQATGAEAFVYFVQVGAYRTAEDAENQRAKLSLAGIDTKVSEREQAGRTVYRVRLGPLDTREEADKAKTKLDASGLDTALVRVQR